MKKITLIALVMSLMFSLPAFAEESDDDGNEKGSRMNPYTLEEGAHLGYIHNNYGGDDEGYLDMTIMVNGILSPEEMADLFPDDPELSEERHLVFDVTVETGDGTNDDKEIWSYIEVDLMSADMTEYWAWIYKYDNLASPYQWFYTHDEQPAVIECKDVDSYDDLDVKYIRFTVYGDEYEATGEQKVVWMEIDDMDALKD